MTIDTASAHLRNFYRQWKRLPSYQEMCTLFGFASKKASFALAAKLIEAGVLAKDEMGKLVPKNLMSLPVLGTIKAGYPAMADQMFFGNVSLEEYVVKNPASSYILKVSGDSMIDAGIHAGDFVIVESCMNPDNGDIVVANLDGEFTLKYYEKTVDGVKLVAANKLYPPFYPQESLEIAGRVVSVIRKYH